MQWYYLDAQQQQIPATEEELAAHTQSGAISGETLLWNETMSDWQGAAALFPAWFPAAVAVQTPAPTAVAAAAPAMTRAKPRLAVGKSPTVGLVKRPIKRESAAGASAASTTGIISEGGGGDNRQLIKDCASALGVNAGWMRFLGILHIIGGSLACLSIVYVFIGWLPIWLGVILVKSSTAIQTAEATGKQDDLDYALNRVGFYFKVRGIYTPTVFILAIVSVILTFVFMGAIMAWAASQAGGGMPMDMPMEPFDDMPMVPPPIK